MLEDVNITYENNDFVNYADQFYLKTLYSFAVFMVSSTYLHKIERKRISGTQISILPC
jgi:hypothetical protein